MFCADNDSFWVVGQTTGDVLDTKQDLKMASMLFKHRFAGTMDGASQPLAHDQIFRNPT